VGQIGLLKAAERGAPGASCGSDEFQTTAAGGGVCTVGAQVLDLMAQIEVGLLQSHDDLVSFRQLLLQPREN